jgi:hypothetical protein
MSVNHSNLFSEIQQSEINTLAKSYCVLDNFNTLKNILQSLYPKYNFSNYSKPELHSIINEILTKGFKGESALKSKLVKMFAEKNVTAAFEMRVNSSRIDFITINGDTKSFEIKSSIDNLTKLTKQVSDYEKVFEYNFIAIDKRHLLSAIELLPENYGIYVLEKGKLIRKKEAKLNKLLDSEMQLKLFTKRELGQHFKGIETSLNCIINEFSSSVINERFKAMLKQRYEKKWNFLKSNLEEILPIDYQYFFNHNIKPKIIYSA